ncbi:hypothetical protein EVAR_79586_1 [Eumeta japonica]|uniref:C-type lectin domain-containing protein n=1 Tax=Eumeta variegata TaxID=151549 RepID=A0A4C1UEI1_EUMVA|nr:hypothetical protein EVAR_79586_1 [Eumeta japonica]
MVYEIKPADRLRIGRGDLSTSLEEAGYAKWGNLQPDGNADELCGTMFYDGLLNDLNCDLATFFICEHDISSLSSAIDQRLSSAV